MDQNCPVDKLLGYNNTAWCKDYFIETIDKKYSLWFYNVLEHTMGAYYGHISIFQKNTDNLPILSSGEVWVWYNWDNTVIYAAKSDCLIFRMPAYQGEDAIKPDFPYLLIKPGSRCFSFIDWNFTSIYYSFDETEVNIIKVKELTPAELDRTDFLRRTGEKIDLGKLVWYELSDFDNAKEIYLSA